MTKDQGQLLGDALASAGASIWEAPDSIRLFCEQFERYDAFIGAQPWWRRLWHRYVSETRLRRKFLEREATGTT